MSMEDSLLPLSNMLNFICQDGFYNLKDMKKKVEDEEKENNKTTQHKKCKDEKEEVSACFDLLTTFKLCFINKLLSFKVESRHVACISSLLTHKTLSSNFTVTPCVRILKHFIFLFRFLWEFHEIFSLENFL